MLAAMSRIDTGRLLDHRFPDLADGKSVPVPPPNNPLPILVEETV